MTFPEPTPTGVDSRFVPISRVPSDPVSLVSQTTDGSNLPNTPLSIVDEGSGNETDPSEAGRGSWWERRRSDAVPQRTPDNSKKRNSKGLQEDGSEIGKLRSPIPDYATTAHTTSAIGSPLARIESGEAYDPSHADGASGRSIAYPVLSDSSELPKTEPQEPIFVESAVRSKRMSTGSVAHSFLGRV